MRYTFLNLRVYILIYNFFCYDQNCFVNKVMLKVFDTSNIFKL